ncbi:MAG: DHH family phosphoesterase [Oscillospiraceae bacterium]|nr:DHH family phosphoesterase [Oscillospiraceae bacterium]
MERLNKRIRQLTQPGLVLYFIIAFLLCLSTAAQSILLALLQAGVVLLLFAVYYVRNVRRKKRIAQYVSEESELFEQIHDGKTPFPVALINLSDSELVWQNQAFMQLAQLRERITAQHISEIFPGFSVQWLSQGKSESPSELHYRGRRYRVSGSILPGADTKSGISLGLLYFLDLTELLQIRDEYIRSRPIVSIILVDNYDELTNNLPDAAISSLNAVINTKINEWTDGYGGMLRKLERNRFLFLFEAKDLAKMAEDKFSLLEDMRKVVSPGGIAATLSIGVGKDGTDFREDYDFAALSIEMALSRGGDQAVIKDRYDFTFFGGRASQTERRTKVKSRVMASSLGELISQSSRIFVMGHKMADLDTVGAAVGVCSICRKKGKKVNIVVDVAANACEALLAQMQELPSYKDCFLSGQDALLQADAKSLLVVVDTNRPDQVECKPLLESMRRVVVIDHHRRAADYIEQVVLNLHDPFASSACEIVAELLQYMLSTSDVLPQEAAAMLSGIALDTKNFGVRTSSRTFEAAAFLRRLGADTVAVKKLFQNDLPSTVARYRIIQTARLYRGSIAIAALDYTATRTIAAQAADELLNILGIQTSFVLYPQGGQVIISARSIGDANVQVILERLGGGGNSATAGAQVKDKSVSETLDELLQSIDKYYEE